MDIRQVDLLMMAIMVVGAILSCMVGFVVRNMAFGQVDAFDEARDDPDFEIFRNDPGAYSGEIDYYGERLNQSMFPICCHDFGEGKEWGDTRR
jgi:hypothetical protein